MFITPRPCLAHAVAIITHTPSTALPTCGECGVSLLLHMYLGILGRRGQSHGARAARGDVDMDGDASERTAAGGLPSLARPTHFPHSTAKSVAAYFECERVLAAQSSMKSGPCREKGSQMSALDPSRSRREHWTHAPRRPHPPPGYVSQTNPQPCVSEYHRCRLLLTMWFRHVRARAQATGVSDNNAIDRPGGRSTRRPRWAHREPDENSPAPHVRPPSAWSGVKQQA